MTVPSTARRAGPFNGTGAAVNYPFTFKVFAKEDVQVTFANAAGVETEGVQDSDYSVFVYIDQDFNPGGWVRYSVGGVDTALPVGTSLTVTGQGLEYEQSADLPSGGDFSPQVIENALDNLEMQIQNLRDQLTRTLQLGVSTPTGVDVTLPAPVGDNVLGWSTDATQLVNLAPDTTVSTAQLRADLANIADVAKGANLVGFNPSLNYAVSTIGYEMKRGLVRPEWFGAAGNNVTDDTTAFTNACAGAAILKLGVFLDPSKRYVISNTITATGNFVFGSSSDTARGGTNTPFTGLSGAVIRWAGGNSTSLLSIDMYTAEHVDLRNFSVELPSTYTGNVIDIKGGPYFTQGGVGSCNISGIGGFRNGTISPQTTNCVLLHVDCTGALANGRVGAGWRVRDLFGFNILSVLRVDVANNTVGTPGLDNWWNSNIVENVYGYQVYRLIHLVGGTTNGNAIWRNTFRNCTNQPGKGLDTLYATGACIFSSGTLVQYNHIDHSTAWDLSSGSEFVLPETNMKARFFGTEFSHTEGFNMFGPSASEQLTIKRPGWNTVWRLRAQGNDSARYLISNNWTGSARDDATAPAAAIALHAENGAAAAVRLFLGTTPTEQYTFEDAGVVYLRGLPTAAPAQSGRLWRDSAAGNVIKMVP